MLGAHVWGGSSLAAEEADVVLDLALPLLREPELSGRVTALIEAIYGSGRCDERLIAVLEGAVKGAGARWMRPSWIG